MGGGSGKRKSARATVWVWPGEGKITVNGKCFTKHFLQPLAKWKIMRPLIISQYTCLLDIRMHVWGGGLSGQADATRLALTRALCNFEPEL